jgi:hypothetical protein
MPFCLHQGNSRARAAFRAPRVRFGTKKSAQSGQF